MNLPEHEKLQDIQPQSQAIGEFLEWAGEQGLYLSEFVSDYQQYQPTSENVQSLLARHFEIDLKVLEGEKVALLDAQRQLNETSALQQQGSK